MTTYEWVSIAFTGVIAISTAVYTYYSHKLWKATHFQCDMARYNTFMSYLKSLSDEANRYRVTQPEVAEFLDHILTLVTELGTARLLDDIDVNNDPVVRDYINKVEGIFRAKGIDPNMIPWFKPILEKMRN